MNECKPMIVRDIDPTRSRRLLISLRGHRVKYDENVQVLSSLAGDNNLMVTRCIFIYSRVALIILFRDSEPFSP